MWASILQSLMGKGKNTKPKVSENSIYMTSVYTSVFFVIEHTVNCFMLHLRSINHIFHNSFLKDKHFL